MRDRTDLLVEVPEHRLVLRDSQRALVHRRFQRTRLDEKCEGPAGAGPSPSYRWSRVYLDDDLPVSLVLPRPPMVPSDGVTPMPLGVDVPLTLVPMRAELEREVLRAPVRRVLLVPPVVARAPVRPELLRVLELRRAAELRVPDDRRVVLRPAGFRAVLRLAGFRVVLRLAG